MNNGEIGTTKEPNVGTSKPDKYNTGEENDRKSNT